MAEFPRYLLHPNALDAQKEMRDKARFHAPELARGMKRLQQLRFSRSLAEFEETLGEMSEEEKDWSLCHVVASEMVNVAQKSQRPEDFDAYGAWWGKIS